MNHIINYTIFQFLEDVPRRAIDFNDVETIEVETEERDEDFDDIDPPWEPRAQKSKTQKCMFPHTAAFAARRNSGETEFTMWVNFACMDLEPFFPGIGKKHALKKYDQFALSNN